LSPRRDADNVTNAQAAGEFGFDGRNFLTQNEPAAREHACDRGIDLGSMTGKYASWISTQDMN
jgi:hypothetical protein